MLDGSLLVRVRDGESAAEKQRLIGEKLVVLAKQIPAWEKEGDKTKTTLIQADNIQHHKHGTSRQGHVKQTEESIFGCDVSCLRTTITLSPLQFEGQNMQTTNIAKRPNTAYSDFVEPVMTASDMNTCDHEMREDQTNGKRIQLKQALASPARAAFIEGLDVSRY
jgi:hypothetical protein